MTSSQDAGTTSTQAQHTNQKHNKHHKGSTKKKIDPPVIFEVVLKDELDRVRTSRDQRKVTEPAHEDNLVGLAFSGGGIRSATFNLGIMQALAERGLLHKFDYLSTVSGGGYTGSWLAAFT